MQDLIELTHIVTKNKVKSIQILDSNLSSRIEEFYQGIISGKFRTDEEAANYFYRREQNGRNYNKLKNKLKKKLLNTLFFIDIKQPSYNNRQKAYYRCHKDWAAVNILFGKNAHATGVELSLSTLKYAEKYEFTGLALDIMQMLRLHYAAREGNLKKYNYYKKLCEKYEPILRAEKQAEALYSDLIINYVNNKSTQKQISISALEAYGKIKDDLTRFDDYNIQLFGALIRLMIHTGVNDYKMALKVCDETIAIFENKNYNANTPLQIAYYQKLVCYTQLKKYEEGKKVAERCLALLDNGYFNWFKYHELYLILLFHTERYDEAFVIFNNVKRHKRFKFLADNIKEIWKIFEAYLYYILSTEMVKPAEHTKVVTKFRLARFINETPIFSKDKAGLNVTILSIQILFLIQQKKYSKVRDKVEAIDKYCFRYLQKDGTMRFYYFIKMLESISRANFHKVATIRKAERYVEKLKALPFEVANQSHNIEIIPYERLWEYALQSLES